MPFHWCVLWMVIVCRSVLVDCSWLRVLCSACSGAVHWSVDCQVDRSDSNEQFTHTLSQSHVHISHGYLISSSVLLLHSVMLLWVLNASLSLLTAKCHLHTTINNRKTKTYCSLSQFLMRFIEKQFFANNCIKMSFFCCLLFCALKGTKS